MNKVIGIVSLDSAVSFYKDIQKYVSWKIGSENATVVQIGCNGSLMACTSINSQGLNALSSKPLREKTCRNCISGQNEIYSHQQINITDIRLNHIDSFINDVTEILRGTRKLSSVMDNYYENIPINKIAFFDFSILTKTNLETELTEQLISRFCHGVKDLLIILENLRRYSTFNFDAIFYVNGNYSQNTVIRLFFEQKSTKCYSIEPQLTSQSALSKIRFVRSRLILESDALTATSIAGDGIDRKGLYNLLKNFGARVDGKDFNAYTNLNLNEGSINDFSKLTSFRKKFSNVHSFFLSSEDELIPHIVTHDLATESAFFNEQNFNNQESFTKYLISKAESCKDVGFVVRLHPRMAVNKRNNFESNEHIRYKKLLNSISIPENVLIIMGDSKLSSYYLIYLSNLVIVSWSTIGIEALLMGKKVISAFPHYLMYPLHKFSKQPNNSFEMDRAIFQPSTYGTSDQLELIKWATTAYETSFFTIFARKSANSFLKKTVAIFFRIIKFKLFYSISTKLFGLCYKGPSLTDTDALEKINVTSKLIEAKDALELLNEYQTSINTRLDLYASKILKQTLIN